MKKRAKQVLTLLTASAVMASLLAGCSGNSSGTTAAGGSSSAGDSGTDSQTTAAGPDDTSERYSFTVYYNYTGWSKTWGQDAASQYMSEKFNVDVNWTAPDSDPMAKLNIMVSSDDLPEVIVMDRGPDLNKIARGGYLQDLSQYMYEGSTY